MDIQSAGAINISKERGDMTLTKEQFVARFRADKAIEKSEKKRAEQGYCVLPMRG